MFRFKKYIVCSMVCGLVLAACRKDEFKSLNKMVPADILDAISEQIPLYEGDTPPMLEGSYVFSPCRILYSSFQSSLIDSLPDYHFKLSLQNKEGKNSFIKFVGDNSIMRIDSCENACLVGKDHHFTAYFTVKGHHYTGVRYKAALILTGTKKEDGFIDCYLGIVLLDKSANNSDTLLMPEGSFRIIKDGDTIVEKTDSTTSTKCELKNCCLVEK
ncbi:MAG: hypothetical protein PHC83_01250 [Bacteroidales bacterium]|nr:hypothetical protein [Bacteroidales bacterium]MDD4209217.1 hypothetical protein [Bacteroidales bacterium]